MFGVHRISSRAARMAAPLLSVLVIVSFPGLGSASTIDAPSSVLTIVAGTGVGGYSTGAGGVATTAAFSETWAVGDADGNYYVAEKSTCRIRKIDGAGLVQPVAGTGTCGFGGDGGLATAAMLNRPSGLWLTPSGDLFFADSANCLVRKITKATGVISTIAGVVPAPGVANCGFSGDLSLATDAKFSNPRSVVVDSLGNVFIADQNNCRIRAVDLAGVAKTVAGNGCGFGGDGQLAVLAKLSRPVGVAIGASGNLLIGDTGNNRIREVNAAGVISTIAGTGIAGLAGDTGPATAAQLRGPSGLSVDDDGSVFLTDTGNCRVRRISAGTITTVAGSTCGNSGNRVAPTTARLGWVANVAIAPGGDLIISDTFQVKVVNGAAARRPSAVADAGLVFDNRSHGNANLAGANWSGGDASYSLGLPDGKVAWLYADSYVGASGATTPGFVRPDHSRVPQPFIGNQLVVADYSQSPPSFVNKWRAGLAGNDFFPAPGGHRYWPFGPYIKNADTMTVLLRSFSISGSRVDGIAVADVSLTTFEPGAVVDISAAALVSSSATDCHNGDGSAALVQFGDSVLVDPDGSGNTYVYGIENCPREVTAYAHLARVTGTDLTNTSAWTYFDGVSWSSSSASSSRLKLVTGAPITDAGHEMSVVATGGGYRMLNTRLSISNQIQTATSTRPEGPFTLPQVRYMVPESNATTFNNLDPTCGLLAYNAKEHPVFESDGSIVLSYNLNVTARTAGGCPGFNALRELNRNVDNYRPRFVVVPADAPLPVVGPLLLTVGKGPTGRVPGPYAPGTAGL